MDQLTKSQSELAKKINTTFLAYQRLPEERKTAKLVKEKLSFLEDAWLTFGAADDQIRKEFPERLDHFYFTEDLYGQTLKVYEDFKNDLEAKLQAFGAQTSSTDKQAPAEESILNPAIQQLVRRCTKRQDSIKRMIELLDMENQAPQYFKCKIERLKDDWASIQEESLRIHAETDNPSLHGFDPDQIDDLDNEIQDVIINLRHRLDMITRSEIAEQVVGGQSARTSVKLPTITIPKFDGEYLKWTQFRDMFLQMIDKQPIESVEKMWYLKTNVTGEAAKLIGHLNISAQNYSTAWKVLNDRYSNTRLLVSSILERLLNQPSVAADCAKGLKRLFDTTQECVLMLESNNLKIMGSWDPMLLHILIKKLDPASHSSYEQSLSAPRELQTLDGFLKFIETRFQSLETLGSKTANYVKPGQRNLKATTCTVSSNISKCIMCGNTHQLGQCEKFVNSSIPQREAIIKKHNLCFNCLKRGHRQGECRGRGCTKCNRKHHTLLHQEQNFKETTPAAVNIAAPVIENRTDYVFLATAIVTVKNKDHQPVECRALLDSGSQINLISERLQKRLKLDKRDSQLTIFGIGNAASPSKDRVTLELQSRTSTFHTSIEAQVIKCITNMQPQKYIDTSQWKWPEKITLADPHFNKPQKVDILLGAEMYGELMRTGQIRMGQNLPTLHNSVLGWMILGKVSQNQQSGAFAGISNVQLEEQLLKFWEVEEVRSEKPQSAYEKKCEEFFKNTTLRNTDGRFIVNIPMLGTAGVLGNSRGVAWRRYQNLERKLQRDTELSKQYEQFLKEYLQLGHMSEINEKEIPEIHYFMPHHGVLRPDKSTTKLRVVFDASCKTTSNISLNDIMMKGAKIQDDLMDILIRFRTYKYAIMGDIRQMFRQIKVAPEDQALQLIMWRPSPADKVRYYKLETVTYGTKAAPYLATRCLKQLAEDEESRYPLGAMAVKDFYMDDIITGANTLREGIQKRNQIIAMLGAGKFELHKWAASDERLLEGISSEHREKEKIFDTEDEGYIKTLGMSWQRAQDNFTFTTTWSEDPEKITKRKIVSEIARLFDPLGLVNPVIVTAKLFIQKLWKQKLEWDQELEDSLQQEWLRFRQELNTLNQLKIGRCSMDPNTAKRVELHAFGDASELAYGAVIYVRTIDFEGKISTKLLCSKSRVAPLKTITLPRLELCAAQLAVELAEKVKSALSIKINETYFWSDAQIVLSWVKDEESTFKTYVAHRVSAIQEKTKPKEWNYVNTKANPADLISRGTLPNKLKTAELWFHGPEFLSLPEEQWPNRDPVYIHGEDEERKSCTLTVMKETTDATQHPLFSVDHKNSFTFLQRVMAYIIRAVRCMKGKKPNEKELSTLELREAQNTIIKVVQELHFKEELEQLKKKAEIKGHSRISTLSPFLDEAGILRVGGRLQNAEIGYEAKHPILLPGKDLVSRLVVEHLHKQNLHAGPLALLAITRQRFWILQGRTLARAIVAKCVQCVRSRPQMLQQKMGNLPKERVMPTRAFLSTGVDFCGPIWTHYHIRGKRPTKSYIAVFCCFTTKAVHLEVVSDLTTEGFIGALRRFMARRGYCKDLHCDNATNFVGAKNKLEELANLLNAESNKEAISRNCAERGIQFHFAPPRAPHFGGLWEAAVKSTKKLLQHTITSASLTFEELCTVTAEAEAVLNSRPLTPMSADPNDLTALTPGHFLIGEPLTTIPEPNTAQNNMTGLTRWKLVAAIRKELWKRWTKEYLCELQHRYKWKNEAANAQPGMMVVIREDNTPPLKWPLARIEEVIKGNDGLARVAIVKTACGTYKRAINRLAPLPIEGAEPGKEQSKQETSSRTVSKRREEQKRGNPKRARHTFNTMFVILAILMFPLLALGNPQLKTINNNAGIYFENLGTGQLAKTEWKIIIYHNLSTYWQTFSTTQKAVYELKGLTESSTDQNYLPMIYQQFEHKLKELEEGNKLLFGREKRRRRGLINVVGNIANKLFGVLDDNYAAQLEGTIDNVEERQDYLLDLMKNQTSVMEASTNLMKRAEEEKIKQFNTIQLKIERMASITNSMSESSKIEKETRIALIIAQYIAVMMNEVQRRQETFIDILTDAQHGKINPGIAAFEQLKEHLEQIKKGLPAGLEIPNTNEIYKLTKVTGKLTTQLAIFMLQMPLVLTTRFELLRLVPFPVKMQHSFFRIMPTAEYLLINAHRDQIYGLKAGEFEKCSYIQGNHHICKQQGPVYTSKAQNLQCEIQLLTTRRLADQCQIKVTRPARTWIQLKEENQWLYSMDQVSIYNMVCNGEPIQMKLSGNGILIMDDDCVLKDDEITIQAYHTSTTRFIIKDQPIVELPTELNVTLSRKEIVEHLNLDKGPFEAELKELTQKLKTLRNQQTRFPFALTHVQHQYVVSYTALIFTALLAILGIISYICKRKGTPRQLKTPVTREDFRLETANLNVGEDVQS